MTERHYIPVVIRGLALDPESRQPVLMLQDLSERLVLPIWIGPAEAAAIAARITDQRPSRPLTPDLAHSMLERLGASVERLDIRGVEEGVFFGDLLVRDREGRVHRFDCRPSDGVAMVLRSGGLIRVERAVMETARPLVEEEPTADPAPLTVSADDASGRQRLLEALADLDPEDLGYKM